MGGGGHIPRFRNLKTRQKDFTPRAVWPDSARTLSLGFAEICAPPSTP